MRHPDVPAELRGSYAGLGHEAVIDHLTRLGVTAVELLPVHQYVPEEFLLKRGLTNYWGYNSIGYFAPHQGYSAAVRRGLQRRGLQQRGLQQRGAPVRLSGPRACWRSAPAYWRPRSRKIRSCRVAGRTGTWRAATDSVTPGDRAGCCGAECGGAGRPCPAGLAPVGAARTIITRASTRTSSPAVPVSHIGVERGPCTAAFISCTRIPRVFPVDSPSASNHRKGVRHFRWC